jgi:HK97 family phage portal protein
MGFLQKLGFGERKALGGILGGFSIRSTPEISDILSGTTNYFNLNDVSLYVNRGIAKRSEKIGQIEFELYKGEEKVEDNEFLNLLDRPNDHQTGDTFWALVNMYRDISGFAVIKKLGNSDAIFRSDTSKVTSLEIMNSMMVMINYDGGNKIVSFSEILPNGELVTTPFEDCIYWIRPNPKKPTEGISLLRAGLYSIDTDNQLSIYQNAIIKNGGSADTVITFENDLTDSVIKEMRERHINERRNPKDSDVPIYLGGKAKAERLGLTPSELAYLETKKIYARDMTIITGVPLSILGITSDETFSNGEVAYRVFLRETIKPICDDLINLLNWKLIPAEYELYYEDPSPEDVDTKIKLATALYNNDASTINERREILDMPRLEDPEADKVFVSFSKTPLGEKDTSMSILSMKKKEIQSVDTNHHILRDKGFRDIYRKIQLKRLDKREAQFITVIRDYFNGQQERVLSNIKEEKKFKNTKALVDDVLDENLEIRLAKGSVLPLLRSYLIQAGKESIELLDGDTKFDMSKTIEKWLDTRAGLFGKIITETTYEKLKREFAESFDKGENRTQLIKRIEGVYAGFDENRAKTIARTEVHGSTQKGNFEGSKQAGSEIKIWVSVLDDRTRDEHAYMDGEEKPIDKRFSNGLMFAGDPSGDGSETINCRCQTV